MDCLCICMGKLLKCHLKENRDRILIILKENGLRASSAPILALFSIIFKYIIGIYSRSQVSVYRTIGPLVSSCWRCEHYGV